MKILGIIAEYNPFHNGHEYHLQKSRELTGADYTIAVMSGNFTQRGELAIFDKWQRSRAAVESGVDLVAELPFVFACNKGEIFARGAVDILKGLGVTHISFGSECGDVDELSRLVRDIDDNINEINDLKDTFMKEGNSFAKSFQLAVKNVLGKEKSEIMRTPNNILALEYLKRIFYWNKRGHAIRPVTIKRYGSGYFGKDENTGFAGATAIRKLMEEDISKAYEYVPSSIENMISNWDENRSWKEKAFDIVRSEIIRNDAENLRKIYCMGEGLEHKFKKEVSRAESLEDLVYAVVSRRYTEAAVRRILAYIIVGLKDKQPDFDVYARILAAGKAGRDFIRTAKKTELLQIPLITNVNKISEENRRIWNTLKYDCTASDMYNIIMGKNLYKFSDKVVMPYIKVD